jgi:hypothetical protein
MYVQYNIQTGSVAKSYMTNGLLIYCMTKNICAIPQILGSPSLFMTLQPILSEYPYICGKFLFLFVSVEWYRTCHVLFFKGNVQLGRNCMEKVLKLDGSW